MFVNVYDHAFGNLTRLCLEFSKEIIPNDQRIYLSMLQQLEHLEIIGPENNFDTKLFCDYSSSNIKYIKLSGLVFECIHYARKYPYPYGWGRWSSMEAVKNVDMKALEEVHLENIIFNRPGDNSGDLDDWVEYQQPTWVGSFGSGNQRKSIIDLIPEEAVNLKKISFVGCQTLKSKFEIKNAMEYLSMKLKLSKILKCILSFNL